MTDSITPQFNDSDILHFIETHYQLVGSLKALPSYCDQNLLLTTNDQQRFIVKIANSAEATIELEMQNAAMAHLQTKSAATPHVIENCQGQLITLVSNATLAQSNKNDIDNTGLPHQPQQFRLRLLSYLDGHFYADAKSKQHNETLWHNLGAFVGQIDNHLSDFSHPGAHRYLSWDLAQGYAVCQSKKYLLSTDQISQVEYFLALYHNHSQPILADLPQGVIHNDANDHNILIDNIACPEKVTGLIDFGDMVHSHIINELAICCAYALMEQAEPLKTLTTIVAGYHSVKPLQDNEIEVLYSLIALRLCTTVCNAAQAIEQQPDNDYLLVSVKPAWALLSQLQALNPFSVQCQLRAACQLALDVGQSPEQIINFRKKHLGKTLSLSFNEPLKMVRGQGAYLFDQQGTPYLDMVNNVCHVGHCHPKVVAAGQAQMAKLNTNTRFLHDNIVEYADKLLATMPSELSVCMLVNSGSEANELAFRLAKNFTGSSELLVVDGAYHGNTAACIDASPYKFNGPGGEGAKTHIHTVALPDPYRGEYQGNTPATALAYADSVKEVLVALASENKQPGAFICESLQGVAGQIIMPDGYLPEVYRQVRAAGGICIADEVQVGFGRVGSHMWAFETQDVVPDIVTLGKPIGNGHPLAAVITTQAIADAFVNGMEYFNTFGGNPVSCAIGSAVLAVIEQEKLQQHALTTGGYFLAKLCELQTDYAIIGDVRGLGLFIGVELVKDRTSKQPATAETAWLIEFFKQHHILLSTEGRYNNIFKIKPPLAFTKADADKFIKVLVLGLQALTTQTFA